MGTATPIYFDLFRLQRGVLLAQVATLLVIADCLAQTAPRLPAGTGPVASTEAPATASASLSNVQEVIISGNSSLLRVLNPWPWGNIKPACTTFRVSAAASLGTIDLYASGLGRTLMAETPTDRGTECPDPKDLRDRITLTKPNLSAVIDRLVAIQISTDQLSTPGASMEGSVIALAGGKRVGEFTLKVERPAREELWTAITWVLTILIPAIITFLIGQLVVKLTAWQKEQTDFREYRLSTMAAVQEFFTNVDSVIRSVQEHPGQTVYALIIQHKILSRMPKRGVRRLSAACAANDLRAVVFALKDLFPEFTQSITQLETSLQQPKQG